MIRTIPLAACAAAFALGVPARLRTVRQRREGGRRLQLRRGRRRGPRHQGLPFGRRQADLRHRHPHRRQRLLRPGLCRGEGRRQPDRRQHPAARLGVAHRRPGARDRDPEPDRAGPDHRRADHDHAAGRRLQRHRQGRRGVRHPGRHHQLVRRHHPEPQRHQPHRPGRVRRRDRRRGAGRVPGGQGHRIGLDRAAVVDGDGQHRGQQPRDRGVQRHRQGAERRRQARQASRSTPARRIPASTPTRTTRSTAS